MKRPIVCDPRPGVSPLRIGRGRRVPIVERRAIDGPPLPGCESTIERIGLAEEEQTAVLHRDTIRPHEKIASLRDVVFRGVG